MAVLSQYLIGNDRLTATIRGFKSLPSLFFLNKWGVRMNKILISFFIIGLFVFSACNRNADNASVGLGKSINALNSVSKISDIKKEENIGKTFTVRGKVVNVMQTQISGYAVSGYKLNDSTETIAVSSKTLPTMNETVTATGTLQQSRYFGLILQTTD
jgi:hypothetical protein